MKEKTMRISGLEGLVNKVLEDNLDSFYYSDPVYGTRFFMQADTGIAKFVYATSVYAGREIYADISQEAELHMIAARGRVYFVRDPYLLSREPWDTPGNLPEGLRGKAITLGEAVDEANRGVRDAFREYFGSLEPETPDRKMEETARRAAREAIIYGKDPGQATAGLFYGIPVFHAQDVVDGICGTCDLEAEALEGFRADESRWKEARWVFLETGKIMENPLSAVTEDELALSGSLNSLEAKNVNATFLYRGKTASGKISPGRILRTMADNGRFHSWEFMTFSGGCRLLEQLGCSENQLSCRDIIKVSYGRKTLYRKEKPAAAQK